MTEETAELIKKADRSLAAAREMMAREDYDFAASRLYYALFYVSEALLLSKGLSFSSHSAVLSALFQYFVKPGLLPKEFHQLIHEAFDRRQEADYEAAIQISREEVLALIERAEKFLEEASKLLS